MDDSNEENNQVKIVKSEFNNIILNVDIENPIEKIDQFINELDFVNEEQIQVNFVNSSLLNNLENNLLFKEKPLINDLDIYHLLNIQPVENYLKEIDPEGNDDVELVHINDPKEIIIEYIDILKTNKKKIRNPPKNRKKNNLNNGRKKKSLTFLSNEEKKDLQLQYNIQKTKYNILQTEFEKLLKIISQCNNCKLNKIKINKLHY